jgi:nucleotide-binding universal stress UspA family protein
MKTLLVPTDFSKCAEYALDYACFIAQKTNSRVILLHVLPPVDTEAYTPGGEWMGGSWAGESGVPGTPLMMGLLKETRKKIARAMDIPACKTITIQDVIETGAVSDQVNAAVQKYKADMIVMGTHGTGGFNEALIGSNAERVVRDAAVPVLSVKEPREKITIDTIVFATDFSEETDLVFPYVKNFADIFNARIRLVKVLSSPSRTAQQDMQEETERIKNEEPGKDYSVTFYYHSGKETGIRHFAQAIEADLIALGTHGRHGLARFFMGSVAESLVNHSPLPVLTINIHKNRMREKKATEVELIEKNILLESSYSGHVPSI